MDPTTQTFLAYAFGFLPPPYGTYAASAIGVAGILSMAASLFAARVKPPAAESAAWLQTAYKVATWPALNFGWARNAVIPGMPLVVQTAGKEMSALAAAAPHLTTVAEPAAIAGAISLATPTSTLVDQVVAGTVPLPSKPPQSVG